MLIVAKIILALVITCLFLWWFTEILHDINEEDEAWEKWYDSNEHPAGQR